MFSQIRKQSHHMFELQPVTLLRISEHKRKSSDFGISRISIFGGFKNDSGWIRLEDLILLSSHLNLFMSISDAKNRCACAWIGISVFSSCLPAGEKERRKKISASSVIFNHHKITFCLYALKESFVEARCQGHTESIRLHVFRKRLHHMPDKRAGEGHTTILDASLLFSLLPTLSIVILTIRTIERVNGQNGAPA